MESCEGAPSPGQQRPLPLLPALSQMQDFKTPEDKLTFSPSRHAHLQVIADLADSKVIMQQSLFVRSKTAAESVKHFENHSFFYPTSASTLTTISKFIQKRKLKKFRSRLTFFKNKKVKDLDRFELLENAEGNQITMCGRWFFFLLMGDRNFEDFGLAFCVCFFLD